MSRWFIGLILGLLLAFAARTVTNLTLSSYHEGKDASNYWSTVARWQEGVATTASVALCGSSVTGRLPGAERGYQEAANYGSDGGSGADAVAMIADSRLPMPSKLVFETNTFERFLIDGFQETVDPKGIWFRIGSSFPPVSAGRRPSKVLYASALGRRNFLPSQVESWKFSGSPKILSAPSKEDVQFSDEEWERIIALEHALMSLQVSGCDILLIQYPSKAIAPEFEAKHQFLTHWFSARLSIPFWNLQALVPKEEVKMTDAVHMAPESAAKSLRAVVEYWGLQ
mgnify:CR=1 FL=1